jgi:hypothetical protein
MFYVYFDIKTGDILKVSNELDNSLHYLEVNKQTYKEFINQEKNYLNYRVIPVPKDHTKFEIIEKTVSSVEFDVDKSIHELEKVYSVIQNNDIFVIVQDLKNKMWKAHASLNDNFITFLSQTNNYYTTHKEIYVTEENNPNILLDVLKVPMEGFLNDKEFDVEFTNSDVVERTDISLYCATVHEQYKHEIRT